MGALILAALAAAGVWAYEKQKATNAPIGGSSSPPAAPPVVTPANAGGGSDAGGVTSNPAPPAPSVVPGLYPIVVQVIGGDGDSYVEATPGGTVGPMPGSSKTFWYVPGESVVFRAYVEGFAPFTAFDHFEGPGVSTHSNPIVVPIQNAGFVRGVFAFLGRVGG